MSVPFFSGLADAAEAVGSAVSTAATSTAKGVEAVASSVVANPLDDVEVLAGTALIAVGSVASPFTAGATISVAGLGASLVAKGVTGIAAGALTKSQAQSPQPSPGSAQLAAQRAASPNPSPLIGLSNQIVPVAATEHAGHAAVQQTWINRTQGELATFVRNVEAEVKKLVGEL